MPGKTEEWSREEIRNIVIYLDAMGFPDEEICRKIWAVCGLKSVSREEVYHALAASKQAKVQTSSRVEPLNVLPTDDIEISDLFDIYNNSIFNYPVPSSKSLRNQWDLDRKELYNREYYSRLQHHSTSVQNSKELKNKILCDKLQDIFDNFSLQNFSVTVFEIKNLGVTTEDSLNDVIDILFEKAVQKPDFSIPYANFCKLLSLLKVPCTGQEGHLVDIGERLFTKCQKEFENNEVNQIHGEEISRPIQDEKEKLQKVAEEKLKYKRQLGTARFMGWLFKLDIFMESVMHQVIENLLLQHNEVCAKCVCLLITAIGNDLNTDKIKSYISDLKKIITKRANTRLEEILERLSDLRKNNWVDCGEEKRSKLIDDILSEGQEEIQKQGIKPLQMEFDDSASDKEEHGSNGDNASDKEEPGSNGDNASDKEEHKNNSSALNPEGKKQYDREFLLNLQFHPLSKQMPSNLPNLDIIKSRGNWVPRQNKNNPKTIDNGAETDAHEEQDLFTKRMPDDRHWRKNQLPMREGRWNMSGKSSKGNYASVDPTKLKLTKPFEIASLRHRPIGKISAWTKASSDGTKSSGVEQASRPAALQNNRYTTDI